MTDFKDFLLKLNKNLQTLQQREAKYGGDAPVALLNQITDHQQAIALTEQIFRDELTEAKWRETLKPLNIDHTLIEGGFFQKILQALSLPSEQQRELRNRQIMLQRMHDFWVKGVLENSLHNEVLIELGIETKPEAVEYPWEMVLQRPDQPNRTLPPGTTMIDVFDESGGSLLILGEPGSGKTTMLLELARQLIARAQADPSQPIPVVFNLSSWGEKRVSLDTWLVSELRTKYNIPEKMAQPWVKDDLLLPLLNGLDEVVLEYRETCIETVNDFRQTHLVSLAVCSRIADYEALTNKLNLHQAVILQPLTLEQIDDYLNRPEDEYKMVGKTLRGDTTFQNLMQSPLMLNIALLAYDGIVTNEVADLVSPKYECI